MSAASKFLSRLTRRRVLHYRIMRVVVCPRLIINVRVSICGHNEVYVRIMDDSRKH